MESERTALEFGSQKCDHGLEFDQAEAEKLLSQGNAGKWPMGLHTSTPEIRKRWPRLHGECPKGCGFNGIAYVSRAHYAYGDW